MKFRAFTLIEMIIVIMIISAMLLITLNISSNQTKELRFRIEREDFVSNYNAYIIKAITSRIDEPITFHLGNSGQPLSTTNSTIIFEDMAQLSIDSFDGWQQGGDYGVMWSGDLERCTIISGPSISTNTSIAIQTSYRAATIAPKCYTLDLSTCKLRSATCSTPN